MRTKGLLLLLFCVLYVVVCDATFGDRISGPKKNKQIKTSNTNSSKDLDKHDSYHSYQYALPPTGIHLNLDLTEKEHTPHVLAIQPFQPQPQLPLLETNKEPIISPDHLPALFPSPYSLDTQSQATHLDNILPLYKDDPKEHLKSIIPIYNENSIVPVYREGSGPLQPLQPIQPIDYQSLDYQHNTEIHNYAYIPGIPGTPWKDYPIYHSIPYTRFNCIYTKYPGYYADVETGCQVWHYCQLDARHDRFLCPNGTLFNQRTRVCDWWYNVHCPSSPLNYDNNADLYRVHHKNYVPDIQLNHFAQPLEPLLPSTLPLIYHKDIDPTAGSLIFAESRSAPKKIAVRVRKGQNKAKNESTSKSGSL